MPDPATAIGGALGIGGALISSGSASDAADAQTAAANQAAQVQWQMYNQNRADLAPWREAGAGAVNALWGTPGTPATTTQGAPIYANQYGTPYTPNAAPAPTTSTGPVYGLPNLIQTPEGWYDAANPAAGVVGTTYGPAYGQSSAQWSSGQTSPQIVGYQPGTTTPATPGTQGLIQRGPGEFKASEGYQWTLGQGQQAQQRQAAATGRMGSGAYLKDATKYAEGLASTEYDNFLRRYYQSLEPYFRMAGYGQGAAATGTAAGSSAGNSLAQTYLAGGQAQAAGNLGAAYPWGQLANYGAGQAGQYAVNQQAMNALNKYQPAPLNPWGSTGNLIYGW